MCSSRKRFDDFIHTRSRKNPRYVRWRLVTCVGTLLRIKSAVHATLLAGDAETLPAGCTGVALALCACQGYHPCSKQVGRDTSCTIPSKVDSSGHLAAIRATDSSTNTSLLGNVAGCTRFVCVALLSRVSMAADEVGASARKGSRTPHCGPR